MNALRQRREAVPSPVLGMMIFIGTEIMFFAGLISAFLVIRAGAAFWPPAGQPRLPVEVTALNTLVLLASGWAMFRAGKAVSGNSAENSASHSAGPSSRGSARRWLGVALALGGFFVLVQGYEWMRLIGFGLTLSSSLFGGIFYVIIGAHGLHVLAALTLLLTVRARLAAPELGEGDLAFFAAARMFWYFVVGVWPLLYGLVYLY